MSSEYVEAANKINLIADNCECDELCQLLRNGANKIANMGTSTIIIKTASVKERKIA